MANREGAPCSYPAPPHPHSHSMVGLSSVLSFFLKREHCVECSAFVLSVSTATILLVCYGSPPSFHPCIYTSMHRCIHASIHPCIHAHPPIHPSIKSLHPPTPSPIHPYIHKSITQSFCCRCLLALLAGVACWCRLLVSLVGVVCYRCLLVLLATVACCCCVLVSFVVVACC